MRLHYLLGLSASYRIFLLNFEGTGQRIPPIRLEISDSFAHFIRIPEVHYYEEEMMLAVDAWILNMGLHGE